EAEKNGGYSLKDLRYSEYVSRLNADLKSKLPPNTMVLFEKADGAPDISAGALPHVVRTDTNLGGDSLDSAFVTFGQYGEPEVALRFNPAGANKFAEITGANVGKRMAIVLDRVVKSAPSIRDRIGGGNAVITLGGRDREKSMAEANMIATALRAGALPASLEQLEERRVGPSLGADSVKAAQTAALVGGVLVLLFMIVYYKGMGVVAAIGTILNLAFLLGLLTSLGATLTLPGIAGIALTVGMAVDANVLINERIREELAVGSSMKLAIKQGYARAMSAILDSNITTAATAVVLLYFGTGPIRGFAVTLLIGICSTLFANVFVSKAGVDFLIERFGVKRISV
ncbi:MAG: protein translocase subunit SecD, partial [Bdellovibrionaceae bacterium]|nr:protein translocase subunit SecD [Pseudobdellovibrionaceae bacterium]